MTVARRLLSPYRLIMIMVLAVGALVALVSYRSGQAAELERAEKEFARRATLRHALAREILGHYEDALFGLASLFLTPAQVTRPDFVRATSRLEGRVTGAQAFEWVPLVSDAERPAVEAMLRRNYPTRGGDLIQFDTAGRPLRADPAPFYYPISFVHPFAGNERAVGYDLRRGPTRSFLEQARASRQMVITEQVRLVQETGNQWGVVMICPVFPATSRETPDGAPARAEPDGFAGFLQCVFRVHDMLDTVHSRQPDTVVDMLFIDGTESDPARRVLYYRPAERTTATPDVTEAQFRQKGWVREYALGFGQRNWRVLFRPRAGWVEGQLSALPLVRSSGLLMLSGLLAGLTYVLGRRAEFVRRQVDERTAELAESRRHLASLFEALPGMAYRCTYDDQLSVVFVSEGALQLTGWTAEELRSGVAHFRAIIHPDDLGRVRNATRGALQERAQVEVEYRIRTRAGEEKWVLSRGHGIYGGDGRLDFFEGLAIDITAQKQAETARLDLERKLLEGQKLESLGLLAGGIAHDFNNLLSSILGNAGLARLDLPPTSPAVPQLRAIEAASLRAADLCRQMLAYAGKGRFVIEPIDLTALTEDLLPLLRISVAHQAALKLSLARNIQPVMADGTQLRQIVMNLVLNAADAIADRGGEITLTTGAMHADQAFLSSCVVGATLSRGDYVFLEVRDAGSGMTPDVLAKIFDPFFTTKFAGRGLGLAAVLGIVRGHHGALRVESTPGVGSVFRLLFPPARQSVAAPKAAEPVAVSRWTRPGHVLVIDDEEPVRFMLVQMLKTFGLTPTPAADGHAGVEAFRANPRHYDIVVLDMLMPGLNGEQTLDALRALNPEVRTLLISGYSEGDVLGRLGGGDRTLSFLAKPFTRDALERKLRELLG
jgi:two-component system, cell cycle sensor histidine kinase and response regulator CckA